MPMTREEFKERWESDEENGGISLGDIFNHAIWWGICTEHQLRYLKLFVYGYKDVKSVNCPIVEDAVLREAKVKGYEMEYNTQPAPTGNGKPIYPLVIDDIKTRADFGKIKYGQYLQATDGRDTLMDAYEEALDLCMYLRKLIEERNK